MLLNSSKTGYNTPTKTLRVLNSVKQEPLCSIEVTSLHPPRIWLATFSVAWLRTHSMSLLDILKHFCLPHLLTFCLWASAWDSEGNFCHLRQDLGGSGKGEDIKIQRVCIPPSRKHAGLIPKRWQPSTQKASCPLPQPCCGSNLGQRHAQPPAKSWKGLSLFQVLRHLTYS